MTDFLDEKRKEITDRLKELKPLVDEYHRLEAAASALAGVGGVRRHEQRLRRHTGRRGPGRPRGSASRKAATATQNQSAESHQSAQSTAKPAQTPRRTAQRQRHACRRGAGVRAGSAGHHDPRARRQDGNQAELPLPRPARPGAEKKVRRGPRLAPEGLSSLLARRRTGGLRRRDRPNGPRLRHKQRVPDGTRLCSHLGAAPAG